MTICACSIIWSRLATMKMVQNVMYNVKSRYIHCTHYTIQQLLSNGSISIDFVNPKNKLSYLFTNELFREWINHTSRKMGVQPKLMGQFNRNQTWRLKISCCSFNRKISYDWLDENHFQVLNPPHFYDAKKVLPTKYWLW